MEFKFGDAAILLPPLHITIIAIIIIFFLIRWSKQLETRRFTVFFYLFRSERNHPSKMKASILGLSIAIYQLILQYFG
ncbi:hypothetical protein SAMN06272722_101181 [Paenibacillus sp. RU5A]|nr:hypothetical protein SAMN06272722_101181 [Paenibacillus sp. RU5A]SOC62921.1 hypothetical protein SAMN05880581_1011010 [Paenibacillus sp. RU26A]SOC68512.1 hypothetical protein SAMN05880586_1011009 [Paenibacillus sp. RU5M]